MAVICFIQAVPFTAPTCVPAFLAGVGILHTDNLPAEVVPEIGDSGGPDPALRTAITRASRALWSPTSLHTLCATHDANNLSLFTLTRPPREPYLRILSHLHTCSRSEPSISSAILRYYTFFHRPASIAPSWVRNLSPTSENPSSICPKRTSALARKRSCLVAHEALPPHRSFQVHEEPRSALSDIKKL